MMKCIFENPKKYPLQKVELILYHENGESEIVPALSKKWIEKRYFLLYEVPKVLNEVGENIIGAKERWIEIMTYIDDDLEWLLTLPFFKFWSNIIHNSQIRECLVSILQNSPTFYCYEKFPDDKDMKLLLKKIRRKVLLIFIRVVTNKVNSTEYITQDYHGKLIYDNYLITIPTLFDLCQLYGRENHKIIKTIVETIMQLHPSSSKDLEYCIQFSFHSLRLIEEKLKSRNDTIKISDTVNYNDYFIEDLIINLMDTLSNLSIFSTIYSPVLQHLYNDYYLMNLVSIYENTIPEIFKEVNSKYYDENPRKYKEIEKYLHVIRMELIHIYRITIFKDINTFFNKLPSSDIEEVQNSVDIFLDKLINILTDKKFILDYNLVYPIIEDLQLVDQFASEKKNFLLQSFFDILDLSQLPKNTSSTTQNNIENNFDVHINRNSSVNTSTQSNLNGKTDIELMSLISNINDIMDGLSDGYIYECLKYYKYDTAAVINAILENTLPEELKKLDKTLPFESMELNHKLQNKVSNGTLDKRDKLEVSVEERTDTTKKSLLNVHYGKRKDKYKNLNDMLNDKSFKKDIADRYAKYGLIEDDYDDEYDDTYESNDVGYRGADDSLEINAEPFTIPRVLRSKETFVDDDDDDERGNDEENYPLENERDNFIENPEILREKRALKIKGTDNRSTISNKGMDDVVGNAKGQENSKQVLTNRNKKNIHKASRSNHNRRSGAEWKRRQGMIPS